MITWQKVRVVLWSSQRKKLRTSPQRFFCWYLIFERGRCGTRAHFGSHKNTRANKHTRLGRSGCPCWTHTQFHTHANANKNKPKHTLTHRNTRKLFTDCKKQAYSCGHCGLPLHHGLPCSSRSESWRREEGKSHLLLLGKFEYTGGPILKVVLEC